MPDLTPRGRIAALVGSHTVVRDGRPVSVYQAVGGQAVDDIAAAVADDLVAPLEAERDLAQARAEMLEQAADIALRDRDTLRHLLCGLAERQLSEQAGDKRGWVYAHDLLAVLDHNKTGEVT